jgi:hypothetical protein
MGMNAALHLTSEDTDSEVTVRTGIYSDPRTVSVAFEGTLESVTIFAQKNAALRLLKQAIKDIEEGKS